jgi:hypothetical protein
VKDTLQCLEFRGITEIPFEKVKSIFTDVQYASLRDLVLSDVRFGLNYETMICRACPNLK